MLKLQSKRTGFNKNVVSVEIFYGMVHGKKNGYEVIL